jgi:L-seryl-tRNA(Ser) seleniumtransferase
MPAEVLDAMNEAARAYAPIRDLTKAVGDRIAQLTGNEAALVTTGAAGASSSEPAPVWRALIPTA